MKKDKKEYKNSFFDYVVMIIVGLGALSFLVLMILAIYDANMSNGKIIDCINNLKLVGLNCFRDSGFSNMITCEKIINDSSNGLGHLGSFVLVNKFKYVEGMGCIPYVGLSSNG